MLAVIIGVVVGVITFIVFRRSDLQIVPILGAAIMSTIVSVIVYAVTAAVLFFMFGNASNVHSLYWNDQGVDKSRLETLNPPVNSGSIQGNAYIINSPVPVENTDSMNVLTFKKADSSFISKVADTDDSVNIRFDANSSTGVFVETRTFTNDGFWFSNPFLPREEVKHYVFHLNSEDAIVNVQ